MHDTTRMSRGASLTHHAGVLLASLILVAPTLPAQQNGNGSAVKSKNGSAVDAKAVDALRKMGAHLRTLKRFGVQVDGVRDEVSGDGQKIQLTGTITYLVRAPNGLRANIRTDRKQRDIIYDGKTLTVYAPRMKYYATVAAPPTIGAMLEQATNRYGIEFPVADLFTWGTARDGVNDLTSARLVGPAYVGGFDTDHYAFRQAGADWQVWIERGANPLPRKLVITTTTEPSQPQYTANLKWDLAARVDDSAFAFVPPKDVVKIPLASSVAVSSTDPQR
jgi:hypothetical protein